MVRMQEKPELSSSRNAVDYRGIQASARDDSDLGARPQSNIAHTTVLRRRTLSS